MVQVQPEESSFTAVLVEKGGRYFFYEPSLAVVASHSTLEGAYEQFVAARQNYVEQLKLADLAIVGAEPVRKALTSAAPGSVLRELALFLGKICIVLLVIGAIGWAAASAIGRSVGQLVTTVRTQAETVRTKVETLKPLSLDDIVSKATDIARDAQNLSEERKAALRQSVGILSQEIAPIVDAWRNPTDSVSSPRSPSNPDR